MGHPDETRRCPECGEPLTLTGDEWECFECDPDDDDRETVAIEKLQELLEAFVAAHPLVYDALVREYTPTGTKLWVSVDIDIYLTPPKTEDTHA